MDLMHIPLTELKIAKTNVRHGVKTRRLQGPHSLHQGTRHPATALGPPERARAMRLLQADAAFLPHANWNREGTAIEVVPLCCQWAKGDDAEAVEASLIENVAHLPMDEMDQFEAFQRLLKGRSQCH